MESCTVAKRESSVKNTVSQMSSFPGYNLSSLILKMRENDDWKNGELHSSILLNSPSKKIVLTIMHDHTEVKSFQSGDSVAIQLIEGKMKIKTSRESVILEQGQLLVLNDKERFSFITIEESSFILTILTGSFSLNVNKMSGN